MKNASSKTQWRGFYILKAAT